MALNTSSRTCLSVSVGVPATHDAAGFAALTYTQVGEIETIADVAQSYAAVTFKNLCTGKTSTLKGGEEQATVSMTVGLDRDDAGQALMATAFKSATQILAIRISEANGDFMYLRAYVMSNTVVYGDADSVKRRQYSFGVVAPTTASDTIVEVNAV